MRRTIFMAVLALALVGAFGLLPGHDASANSECFDRITGAGWITSLNDDGTGATEKGKFSFSAGYMRHHEDLSVHAQYDDKASGFKVKAVSIDRYEGYNCFDANSNACYDRLWAGDAEVDCDSCLVDVTTTPWKTGLPYKGLASYTMEVTDDGVNNTARLHKKSGAGVDWFYISMGAIAGGGGFVDYKVPYFDLLGGGNIAIHRPSEEDGCQ